MQAIFLLMKVDFDHWTYLRDPSILKRIGVESLRGASRWAICRREDFGLYDDLFDESPLDDIDVETSAALSVYDPDFRNDSVAESDSKMSFIQASIVVMEKCGDDFTRIVAKYDRTGRYRLEDGTPCSVFNKGYACSGLLIPQVKFNNNMVRAGGFVRHAMGVVKKNPAHRGDRHVRVPGRRMANRRSKCEEYADPYGYDILSGDCYATGRMAGLSSHFNGVTREYLSRRIRKGYLTAELERQLKSDRVLGHVPFDIYVVLGVVFSKLYQIQSGYAGMKASAMPSRVFISCEEIYSTLMPGGHRLSGLRDARRREFLSMLDASMRFMNEYGIMYDRLDGRPGYSRDIHLEESLMRSHRVFWRRDPDDAGSEEVYGYEIEVGGWWLYDFVFEKALSRGSGALGTASRAFPRCIHLAPRDYNPKSMIGMERTNLETQFLLVDVAYHVRYSCWRVMHGMDTEHNQLDIGLDDIHSDFYGGFFDIPDDRGMMDTVYSFVKAMGVADCDRRIEDAMAKSRLDGHEKCRRRVSRRKQMMDECSGYAHIQDCEKVVPEGMHPSRAKSRFRVRWRPIERDELPLGAKQGARRLSRDELNASAMPEPIRQEAEKQREINDFNRRHKVLLGKVRVGTDERLCARAKPSENGAFQLLEGVYLRSYSPGRRGIQGLTRKERARITIDGEAVAEADYSSLHPRMLYAMEGKAPPKTDIYDAGRTWYRGAGLSKDDVRSAVKMALLLTINARSPVQAHESFRLQWRRRKGLSEEAEIPWVRKLFRNVERAHGAIKGYFYTGVCTSLMWLDGMLIRQVCLRLTREGIPALAIHDSVVVRERDCRRAVEVMREEFSSRWPGCEIPVKCK